MTGPSFDRLGARRAGDYDAWRSDIASARTDRLAIEACWAFRPSELVRRLHALADIYAGSGNQAGARDLRDLLVGDYNPLPPDWPQLGDPPRNPGPAGRGIATEPGA